MSTSPGRRCLIHAHALKGVQKGHWTGEQVHEKEEKRSSEPDAHNLHPNWPQVSLLSSLYDFPHLNPSPQLHYSISYTVSSLSCSAFNIPFPELWVSTLAPHLALNQISPLQAPLCPFIRIKAPADKTQTQSERLSETKTLRIHTPSLIRMNGEDINKLSRLSSHSVYWCTKKFTARSYFKLCLSDTLMWRADGWK